MNASTPHGVAFLESRDQILYGASDVVEFEPYLDTMKPGVIIINS